ncbi:putative uncharacterized protein DDB_G0290521 [Scylla paramamosain]|uniref:putative uncharacterized protein DDB_G0290521 n=1 Tax=Scylla paramamosain TaxID=85552 RepID=UPI00308346F9
MDQDVPRATCSSLDETTFVEDSNETGEDSSWAWTTLQTAPPTPTPSSVPTPSPFPVPTPSPSPVPTPSLSPVPTPGPSSGPTPTPSSGPTPGPSSGPTPTPSSGPTPGPSSGPTEREFQETQPQKRRKKADQKDVLDLLLKQIASKEEASREFTHYAKAWVQELAKMDPTQAEECCRIISDAIYKGK